VWNVGRNERKELIRRLQQHRGSTVITYVTGDRAPAVAQIADDALRPLHDHIRPLGRVPRLDLYLYSRGGAIDVPWRVVNMLRRASDEWHVLIPFRASSAATMIALGADEIVMGPQGELGPIDAIISIQRFMGAPGSGQPTVFQDNVSVEDVMAYVKFVQNRLGLADQSALAASLGTLTLRLDAVALGNVYRTQSHIRDVARRILLSQKTPGQEETIAKIIETLAERVYAHGHAIALAEAQAIGLNARLVDETEDELMWALLVEYEQAMKLREPIDPAVTLANADVYTEPATIAMIESEIATHELSGMLEVRGRRQIPPTLNVAVNIGVNLLGVPHPTQIPMQAQQILQQVVQHANQELGAAAQHAVLAALRQQAPLVAVEPAFRGSVWIRSS
jgi:Serine dehydrogenase proteinase